MTLLETEIPDFMTIKGGTMSREDEEILVSILESMVERLRKIESVTDALVKEESETPELGRALVVCNGELVDLKHAEIEVRMSTLPYMPREPLEALSRVATALREVSLRKSRISAGFNDVEGPCTKLLDTINSSMQHSLPLPSPRTLYIQKTIDATVDRITSKLGIGEVKRAEEAAKKAEEEKAGGAKKAAAPAEKKKEESKAAAEKSAAERLVSDIEEAMKAEEKEERDLENELAELKTIFLDPIGQEKDTLAKVYMYKEYLENVEKTAKRFRKKEAVKKVIQELKTLKDINIDEAKIKTAFGKAGFIRETLLGYKNSAEIQEEDSKKEIATLDKMEKDLRALYNQRIAIEGTIADDTRRRFPPIMKDIQGLKARIENRGELLKKLKKAVENIPSAAKGSENGRIKDIVLNVERISEKDKNHIKALSIAVRSLNEYVMRHKALADIWKEVTETAREIEKDRGLTNYSYTLKGIEEKINQLTATPAKARIGV